MPKGEQKVVAGRKRREEILSFVRGFVEVHGFSPTVREVGAGVGLVSPGATHVHLERLVADGMLRKVYDEHARREVYVP